MNEVTNIHDTKVINDILGLGRKYKQWGGSTFGWKGVA